MKSHMWMLLFLTVADFDLVVILRRALQMAGLSDKDAYGAIGMGQAQFSRQMSGQEPPSCLSRMAKMPAAVRQWFALLTLEAEGLPVEVKRATTIGLALLGRKRMARMSRASANERRTA